MARRIVADSEGTAAEMRSIEVDDETIADELFRDAERYQTRKEAATR